MFENLHLSTNITRAPHKYYTLNEKGHVINDVMGSINKPPHLCMLATDLLYFFQHDNHCRRYYSFILCLLTQWWLKHVPGSYFYASMDMMKRKHLLKRLQVTHMYVIRNYIKLVCGWPYPILWPGFLGGFFPLKPLQVTCTKSVSKLSFNVLAKADWSPSVRPLAINLQAVARAFMRFTYLRGGSRTAKFKHIFP